MKFEIWPDGAIDRLGSVAKQLHRLGVTESEAVCVLAVAAASEDIEEDDRIHLAHAVIDDVGLWPTEPPNRQLVSQPKQESRPRPPAPPRSATALIDRGLELRKLGHYGQAIEVFRQVVDTYREDFMARDLRRLGRDSEAIEVFRQVVD